MNIYIVLITTLTLGCVSEIIEGSGEELSFATSAEDYEDDVGETYKYVQNTIQIFQFINGENLYLDTSNHELSQYIILNESPHKFLNLIQYTLERNSASDDDNQIVLRHEISLYYFCITDCGKPYMSAILTTDCIFVRELVQDITYFLEKIHLKRKIQHEYYYFNMEYGRLNFKDKATLYSKVVNSDSSNKELTPLMDMANADLCETEQHTTEFFETTQQEKYTTTSASVNLTIIIVSLTCSVVILGVLILIVLITRRKRRL